MTLITGPLWSGKRDAACRLLGCTRAELAAHAVWDVQELAAACQEKGNYCAEHAIAVPIDDRLEHCLSAQKYGVHAVLAVSKSTLDRGREVRYAGANWKQIDMAVHHIAGLIARRKLL